MRHQQSIRRSLLSGANRTTFAHTEFFSVWPCAELSVRYTSQRQGSTGPPSRASRFHARGPDGRCGI